jgi:SpoIIAA-like
MLTFQEKGSGNVLGVKVIGKLTHFDYQQLISKLETRIQKHGKIRVLVELEDCKGWDDPDAAWDDLKVWLNGRGDIDRCAVVGERKWQERVIQLTWPFFTKHYFDKAELEKAWQWVLEGSEAGLAKA